MRWVPDRTGRFPQRPHWQPEELDAECDAVIAEFRRATGRPASLPLTTDDLTVLLESMVEELDLYADLSSEPGDVHGVTSFTRGARPTVRISGALTADPRRVNRLRTTLTHEIGHVRLHAFLVDFDQTLPMFESDVRPLSACRRDSLVDAPVVDWLEWQAAYASGSLLMPRGATTAVVRSVHERGGSFGPATVGSPLGESLVAAVIEAFEVSSEAATVRLRKLNHLVDSAPASAPLLPG